MAVSPGDSQRRAYKPAGEKQFGAAWLFFRESPQVAAFPTTHESTSYIHVRRATRAEPRPLKMHRALGPDLASGGVRKIIV